MADSSLNALLELARPSGEVKKYAHCYFTQNDMLIRKWVSEGEQFVGESVYQIVVPLRFHGVVFQSAHDESSHLSVRKTYDCILKYFYWRYLKKEVFQVMLYQPASIIRA